MAKIAACPHCNVDLPQAVVDGVKNPRSSEACPSDPNFVSQRMLDNLFLMVLAEDINDALLDYQAQLDDEEEALIHDAWQDSYYEPYEYRGFGSDDDLD